MRRARELLTDPALRALVSARITGKAALAAAAAAPSSAPVLHVIEIVDPYRPLHQRPWFAVLFTAIGAIAGGYLLGLS